jgi:hypothetical protein
MPFTGILDKQGTTTTYDSGATATDRGPTLGLWKDFPARGESDPRYGFTWHDDFLYTILTDSGSDIKAITSGGAYAVENATSGSVAQDTNVGNIGVALLNSGATTDDQGVQIQGGPVVAPAAGRKIAFETRLQFDAIGTGPIFFAGLSIIDTSVFASGANTSTDHVGFECVVAADKVLTFHTEDGGTRISGATSPHTLVEDTYVKLGFLIDGNAGASVTVYVNGVKTGVAFTADPDICTDTLIVPTIAALANGTTQPIAHVDWMRCGVTSL